MGTVSLLIPFYRDPAKNFLLRNPNPARPEPKRNAAGGTGTGAVPLTA